MKYNNEIVTINLDSDDDNNNENSSPDRHQFVLLQRDSDATGESDERDSTSSDVVLIGESEPTIEDLSRIRSTSKFYSSFWFFP